ncbi:MAG: hypothetical protein HW380_130 [Magnetococcales bacterium]|nr:hypothetical protein [Magnetococcales bacterium]HIJ83399.1 hypothetical protein [Magnetococcales bacterium]
MKNDSATDVSLTVKKIQDLLPTYLTYNENRMRDLVKLQVASAELLIGTSTNNLKRFSQVQSGEDLAGVTCLNAMEFARQTLIGTNAILEIWGGIFKNTQQLFHDHSNDES